MVTAHIHQKHPLFEREATETMVVRQLIEGLARHRVNTVIFSPKPARNRAERPPATSSLRDQWRSLDCREKSFRARSPVLRLSSDKEADASTADVDPLSFDLPGMLAREPEIDLIHSHTSGRLGGIALRSARRRKVPFVLTISGGIPDRSGHPERSARTQGGLDWGRPFSWWWRADHVFADADAIVTFNEAEAERLKARYPDKPVLFHPPGVETDLYRTDHRETAREAFPGIANRRVLLCPGRIDPVNNQLWLVRRMRDVAQRHPESFLVFAGNAADKAYVETLRRWIVELRLRNRVLILDDLPEEDPRRIGLFQEAAAVVLPFTSETYGFEILEAWAAGTPVLASRSSRPRVPLRHGENGWFFNLAYPLSFHAAVDRALIDPGQTALQSAEGTRLVEDKFDATKTSVRLRDLYERLITEPHELTHSA